MPVAVLLDLDNTLIDRAAAHRRYCEDFAQRFLSDWPRSAREALVREMVASDDLGYTPREEYFGWLAHRLGPNRFRPAELWKHYRDSLPAYFSADAGVCRLLKRLSERYRLAIVSNGSGQNQRRKLHRAGLSGLFEHVVISGEIGYEKPDPAIFERALKLLDCLPREALFVGDDPQRDMTPSARLGMETCWIRLGRSDRILPVPPTFQIETVLELEPILLR